MQSNIKPRTIINKLQANDFGAKELNVCYWLSADNSSNILTKVCGAIVEKTTVDEANKGTGKFSSILSRVRIKYSDMQHKELVLSLFC